MRVKLYVVAGSHPCWAVKRALELKGISFKRVEWPPTMHVAAQRLRFGQGTVPGLSLNGERVVGSRRIMHRLDELVPEPRLYPHDPDSRARVEEADRWGDEVLQALARRLVWWGIRRAPASILSFAQDSTLPFPPFVTRALAPAITPVEWRINDVSDDRTRADLRSLPEHLERIDGWVGESLLGAEQPNAADLQIGASIALLRTNRDVRPLLAGRPSEELALRQFAEFPGDVPAGTFPADWLTGAATQSSGGPAGSTS